MDASRDVPKWLRGTDFRRAMRAIAAVRGLDRAQATRLIPAFDAPDEQRAFQLLVARLVAEGGVANLAARWRELPSPEMRERFVGELGQALDFWDEEATVDLALAALDDPALPVKRRAVTVLLWCCRPLSPRDRKAMGKTQQGARALEAADRAAGWITAARRRRIAAAAAGALGAHRDDPKALTWPDDYIELLGLTASRGDAAALNLLEALRPRAGEPRRTEFERLDAGNLPRETALVAERKGIAPGRVVARVRSVGTGLLDLARLDQAVARIRSREAK